MTSITFWKQSGAVLNNRLNDHHNLDRRSWGHVEWHHFPEDKREEQVRRLHTAEGWSEWMITPRLDGQLPHPSARGQSKLGPRTMAMLLGVILFTACCSDNRDRNWTRYLTERQQKQKHTWFTVNGKNGTAKEYLKSLVDSWCNDIFRFKITKSSCSPWPNYLESFCCH